jgi:putative transcriptional regulator
MLRCHLSRLMGEGKLRIADVARATGVNRNLITLLYYERAKRMDFESLERLCRFFNCPVGEFLQLEEKPSGAAANFPTRATKASRNPNR